MVNDLPVSINKTGLMRRDWGLQNLVGADHAAGPKGPQGPRFGTAQVNVTRKVQTFISRAVFPQQLTIPRQYATTREGVFVHSVLEGRIIDGVQEQGVRIVVQENAQMARFVISPLLDSKFDAQTWAKQHMGAL